KVRYTPWFKRTTEDLRLVLQVKSSVTLDMTNLIRSVLSPLVVLLSLTLTVAFAKKPVDPPTIWIYLQLQPVLETMAMVRMYIFYMVRSLTTLETTFHTFKYVFFGGLAM